MPLEYKNPGRVDLPGRVKDSMASMGEAEMGPRNAEITIVFGAVLA